MPKTPKKRKRWYRFELWQDGMVVAAVESYKKTFARNEIDHYALVYGQDGPIEIVEVP